MCSSGSAAGSIVLGFAIALAYLASSTAVSSLGYETQRLAAEREELRRENALLEIELARLAAPARIEAEATRLGLERLAFIPVVPQEPVAASR